jgi:UDP-hydrolysing UDP-N-acetyl-D-glucosamine 2-epimerase
VKIFLLTGSRAEYGSQKRLIELLSDDSYFDLRLIVTGTHLSESHGYTVRELIEDGVVPSYQVKVNIGSPSSDATAITFSSILIEMSKIFQNERPDLLLLVGDRFETLATALAAMFLNVPMAHIHGGEVTEGAFDDAIRHSLTKISYYHFVANEEFKDRVIQLGENPSRVFVVGGLGIDSIANTSLLSRLEVEDALGVELREKAFLVTFHPTTNEGSDSLVHAKSLFEALDAYPDFQIIFTMPNADPLGLEVGNMIRGYAARNSNVSVFDSLGQRLYLSCLPFMKCVVGNSSSGLSEVPTFGIPTVNIGIRQKGRPEAISVITTGTSVEEITTGIDKALSIGFQIDSKLAKNPFGVEGASLKIFSALKSLDLDTIKAKSFYDLPKIINY